MTDPHSIAIPRLVAGELHAFRLLARSDRSFEARLATALRLAFFATLRAEAVDPEARLGLAVAAGEAVIALVGTPAGDRRRLLRKRGVLRMWIAGASPDPALADALAGAVEAEGVRLGLSSGAGREPW